ncbi:hypothetical protein MMC22_002080 [Lobaria immixta]|nr:hypothetical protein [Lobaria immixta]
MATYEVEHNIPTPLPSTHSHDSRRRPDFSTFFATMAHVDTNSVRNAHALPLPTDVAAANRGAAEAYAQMMEGADGGREGHVALLEQLVQALMRDARDPPKMAQGVGQDFLDDPYPLVIRLPCHASHIYDLECIAPWLKLQSTCPLDRVDLLKKKNGVDTHADVVKGSEENGDEEEGEWDDMYA